MVIGKPMGAQGLPLGQPMSGQRTVMAMGSTRERTPFGERLFQARTYAGMSQGQLARVTGISQGTLGELEWKGDSSVYSVRIAMACGVRPEWLAENAGSMLGEETWPFRHVKLETIQALDPQDRAFIEGVLANELDRLRAQPTPEDLKLFNASTNHAARRPGRRKAA
jgi:transcriptional regulator with XRE-family HTH domain